MRTTIDLPENVHKQLLALARDTSRSLNQTVVELLNASLMPGEQGPVTQNPETGLPVVLLGRVITTEDVRTLEDDV